MSASRLLYLLNNYLAAKAKYDEAARLHHRAGRTFDQLSRHIGDERAWVVAGMSLTDERSVRACQKMLRSFETLKTAMRGQAFNARLKVGGAIWCANLRRPANENRISA